MPIENVATSDLNPDAIDWYPGDQLAEPWPKTLPEWWANASQRLGDQVVIIDDNGAWSWPQLVERARSWAASWTTLSPGDRILLIGKNSVSHLLAELAIWMRGGVPVPLASNHQELTHIIEEIDPVFALIDESIPLNISIPSHSLEQWKTVQSVSEFNCYPFDINDLALILYTSGSSGVSKGVMLSHGNICSQQAAFTQLWPEIGIKDSCVSYLPWYHSFGALAERLWAIGCGCCLHVLSELGEGRHKLIHKLIDVGPSIFMSVPKIHHQVALGKYLDTNLLRWVFTAGAPLGQAAEQAYQQQGVSVLEGWGLTEASPSLTITRALDARKQGLVGHPIPGVRIGIHEGREIVAAGPGIMLGYWRNEQMTQSVLHIDRNGHRLLRTGDAGRMTPDGLLLEGRLDQLIKHPNGEKIPLARLEAFCTEALHPVREVEYIQIAIDEQTQGLVLLILASQPLKLDTLKRHLCAVNEDISIPWQRIGSIAILKGIASEQSKLLTISHKVSRRKVNDLWYGNPLKWDYSLLTQNSH